MVLPTEVITVCEYLFMKTITLMLLLFTSVSSSFAADNARHAQNDNIREAVFRYQFDHARPSQKESAKVYFMAVAEADEADGDGPEEFLPLPLGDKRHDPSDALMSRFKEHMPPVRKNSALQARQQDAKPGLRFRVTTINWKSDTEVQVSGGHDDAWSASWTTFTVRKENGKWKVAKAELQRAIVA